MAKSKAKPEGEKRPVGRPRIEIDPRQVEALAALGCTVDEIAGVLGCSSPTIERNFDAQLVKGRASIRMRLRQAQIKAALGGNVTMQIWLGKNMLKQSDKVADTDVKEEFNLDLSTDPNVPSE